MNLLTLQGPRFHSEQVVDLGDLEGYLKNAEKVIQIVFVRAMGRLEEAGISRNRVTTKTVTGGYQLWAKAIVEEAKTAAMAPLLWVEEDSRVQRSFL